MSCPSTCGRDSNGPVEGLSIDTSLVFYCLARECLRNIRQHSGVRRAIVRLAGSRRAPPITVWDNGRPGPWAGLRNMKTRVEEAGGQLAMTSKPGSTRVTATIP